MKKIYLVPIIPFVIGIICFLIYSIIGSHVAPDGILIEPFGLLPLGWLFIIIGIISGVIVNIWLWSQKKINQIQKLLTVVVGIFLLSFGVYMMVIVNHNLKDDAAMLGDSAAISVKDATYLIEDHPVQLVNGVSEINIPDSASKQITRYFGNTASGDLNNDHYEDTVLLLTQNSGGSGTFYYVAVALLTRKGFQGTNAILLGDRIAPQTTEIRDGKIIVNYADRNPEEPFSVQPSRGVSKYFQIIDNKLVTVQ